MSDTKNVRNYPSNTWRSFKLLYQMGNCVYLVSFHVKNGTSAILKLRLGTRPGNSSLARKIRVSGTKMAYSILENSIQVITFFRVDISEVNNMSIHYRQYTDPFSILNLVNYLQNHCLWRKNGQKLVLYYLENSKLPTKSSFVEKKRSKLVLYYPENHRKSHLG